MKNSCYVIFIGLIALIGCSGHQPELPMEVITIGNYTDSALYVFCSCEDSLPIMPFLKLFDTATASFVIDEKGNKLDSIYCPNYRINAYSGGNLSLKDIVKDNHVFCKNKSIKLYFIKEQILRTKSWNEIYKKQLYARKIILTDSMLVSSKWKYIYYPVAR